MDHVYSGPLKADLTIKGGKAIVRFDHVGDGLVYQLSIDGISGVYVKGKETAYHWANVEVTGRDTIEEVERSCQRNPFLKRSWMRCERRSIAVVPSVMKRGSMTSRNDTAFGMRCDPLAALGRRRLRFDKFSYVSFITPVTFVLFFVGSISWWRVDAASP